MAVDDQRKELAENAETKMKLESVVRDANSAMHVAAQEHRADSKSRQQRAAMPEREGRERRDGELLEVISALRAGEWLATPGDLGISWSR